MVEESLDHLLEPVREVALKDKEYRLQFIRMGHWFGYRSAHEALDKLEQLINHPPCQRMPNLLIIGPTNNGKSTLIEKFCRGYPPKKFSVERLGYYNMKHQEIPVLTIQMPSNPDVKRFYGMILYKIGIPVPASMRVGVLESEVLHYLTCLKVKMLVIDEIHNILGGRTEQQREFLNLLRFLGNELKIPLVCVGTKDAYMAIRSDDQLENRFEPFPLPPWQAGDEYNSLLASYASLFPLKRPSQLTSHELSEKILTMTEGVLGEISTLLTRSAIRAVETGYEQIDNVILKTVSYQSPTERRRTFERELK